MPRKSRKGSEFGARLLTLRKQRQLTQVQLAEAIGSTQRAISYYETEGAYPPAPVVADLARALDVTTDELLGIRKRRPQRPLANPDERRLWKKFQRLSQLPEKDQRAVFRLINSLTSARRDGGSA